jgi:FMN-dependent NADH-azoreductase
MGVLLHVSASPRGAASHSRRIGRAFIGRLREAENMRVIERDLSLHPLPHPDQAFADASLMAAADRGAAESGALTLSETLIAELETADLVMIDTPMHNFTLPSALKSWIDHVVRAGRTFASTADGKVGLLRDRPVLVVITCGGRFSDTRTGQTDFLTPYLRYVLATMGLCDVSTLRLENLCRGTAAIARAEARAAGWITDKVAGWQERQQT